MTMYKVAGILGCLFALSWNVLFIALLVDTATTGGSEWAPWAAQEARGVGEFLAGYAVGLIFGGVVGYRIAKWTYLTFKF